MTRVQAERLPAYRDRWAAIKIGNAPGTRAAAEEGVRFAYAAAGLAAPQRIEWCDGPAELAELWANARATGTGGRNVRSDVVDAVRETTSRHVLRCLGAQARVAVLRGLQSPPEDAAATAAGEAVARRVDAFEPPFAARLGDALLRLFRMRTRAAGWPRFERAGTSSYALGWLAPASFLREACGMEPEGDLRGLELIASNAGWIVPHADVCWLAARHTTLAFDARGRLHNATGPALAFPDGSQWWCWKGTEVPSDAIEQPGSISPARVDREPNPIVRRCLIEIMTPARFIALGGARQAGHDETGVLWRKAWWTGDAWAAVEVIDGTPGPDGVHRHYFLQVPPDMRSPRAAVAWSYGVSEQQYAQLEIRT